MTRKLRASCECGAPEIPSSYPAFLRINELNPPRAELALAFPPKPRLDLGEGKRRMWRSIRHFRKGNMAAERDASRTPQSRTKKAASPYGRSRQHEPGWMRALRHGSSCHLVAEASSAARCCLPRFPAQLDPKSAGWGVLGYTKRSEPEIRGMPWLFKIPSAGLNLVPSLLFVRTVVLVTTTAGRMDPYMDGFEYEYVGLHLLVHYK